ncbi:FkbM family methyltransferase [Mucilaginibacter calamicampi]|uniref:FkbM family methyltransferase n=1 Tax=Mucilaginibacter calamicampi TaxID=1302352 RepID=A0ABW2YV16_9SPHI
MDKLKSLVKKIVFTFIKPPVVQIYNTNSQAGEDKIVEFLFKSKGIQAIRYIDIGANDPIGHNNTYLFYSSNSSGVLIEPDTTFISRLEAARPRDTVINAAVSTGSDTEAELYVFADSALNTLSKADAELRQASGLNKILQIKKVPLLTIAQVIDQYMEKCLPDLVSLDVEGVDLEILRSFPFEKYPVPVWIVETCAYSEDHIKPKNTEIIDLMLSRDYFVYADTYINTIFVHQNWFKA